MDLLENTYRTLMEMLLQRLKDISVNPVRGAIREQALQNENMFHNVSSNKA